MTARRCKDCAPDSRRPAPNPGPRCVTHWRAERKRRKAAAHERRTVAAYGLDAAGYGLGWRVYEYEGHRVAYHAGAVQGYRGMIAVVPELELGIALMWNGESTIPSSMLPTILDRAFDMPSELTAWLSIDFDPSRMYAEAVEEGHAPGSSSGRASAAPR